MLPFSRPQGTPEVLPNTLDVGGAVGVVVVVVVVLRAWTLLPKTTMQSQILKGVCACGGEFEWAVWN